MESSGLRYVVLTGNPNCGKTTLFNALTGLRAKVGNYAGVTVERKEGPLLGSPEGLRARVLDLPGTYSLSPQSMDEQVSRDVLLNRLDELPPPSVAVIVVDASNLQRNLYYVTQVLELRYPSVIALNMMDVAEQNGHKIDAAKLAHLLGAAVVPVVASTGKGLPELRAKILEFLADAPVPVASEFCDLPEPLKTERRQIADLLAEAGNGSQPRSQTEAFLLLANERHSSLGHYGPELEDAVSEARYRLDASGLDWRGAAIESRYRAIAGIQEQVTTETMAPGETYSDRLDRVLTHRIWGNLLFLCVMVLMFQSIFTLARPPMEALQTGVDRLGEAVGGLIPPGDLRSLLADGVIAGVGAVVVFLPQIVLLFFFIGFLEDTGYMARAAFLMDRLMSKVGLHGKSFIPMLSSFACAIPGIMSTRTIESSRDRLVTIMVCPLMSCSARLPVYTLLISACIPNHKVLGLFGLQGITMLGMYFLGILGALLMAWAFKRTILRGEPPLLIMELPPYKRPLIRTVLHHVWDRSKVFLKQAGTVILGVNIILWFLATYPRDHQAIRESEARRSQIQTTARTADHIGGSRTSASEVRAFADQAKTSVSPVVDQSVEPGAGASDQTSIDDQLEAVDRDEAGVRLRNSYAGRLGRLIEPIIAPLGFDWKIGIGLVSSLAAREVFVSTMSTIYSVGNAKQDIPGAASLVQTLRAQRRLDGSPVYSVLTGLTLLVFYVFALQCVSTIAIVRRETNSWRWAAFQWAYLSVLAWSAAFITVHIGRLLGLS